MARTKAAPESTAATTPIASSERRHAMDVSAADAVAVTPEVATNNRADVLPFVRTTGRQFVYAWRADQWLVMAGKLVPALRPIRLQPGVDGVGQDKAGRITFGVARQKLEMDGWNLLAHNLGPGGSYLRATKVDPTGGKGMIRTHYHSAWETCHKGSTTITTDEAGYVEWLQSLITAGEIDPCPAHVATKMLDEARASLPRRLAKHKGASTGEDAPDIIALRSTIRVLSDYLNSLSGDNPAAASVVVPEIPA